ncbi:MAG: hypothetical protein IT210_22380, partial [Armatimonadetes bacterium]|nr:hypothetical protein [Armatimonadota bacterium]
MKSNNHFRNISLLTFVAMEFLLSSNIWAEPQTIAQFQAKDKRLSAKATLIMKGISLGDAVQQMTKQTGVKLSVQPSWADQKIQLLVQGRLLHEVLAALEHLYPGYWVEKEVSSGQEYTYKPEDWLLRKRKSWWQDVNTLANAAEDQRKEYQRNHFDERLRAVMQSQGQNPEENGG